MSVQAASWAIEQACATATEKAVLLVVASYAGPDGTCYPGQETIARQACCSIKTVERALAAFEERGWITRQHRQRKDGSRTSDLIHMTQVANPEAREDQPDTVSDRRNPTRHPVQSNPTPCPIQPDTVSGLTTFEPLGEPLGEREGRASRLPPEWIPEPKDMISAIDTLGAEVVTTELDKFRDYWRAVPGAKGRKLDWSATFRNWIRRASESKSRHDRQPSRTAKSDHLEAVARAMVAACDGDAGQHRRDPPFAEPEDRGGGYRPAA